MKTREIDADSFFEEKYEECGIFGITNNTEAANYTYLGLHGLQHRGQEACGIATTDGKRIHRMVGKGKVADFFTEQALSTLAGTAAIGHVRYSTTGSSTLTNAQPLVGNSYRGFIALGHNGNLVNAQHLRLELEKEGSLFSTTSDSEVVLHLMARSREENVVMRFIEALDRIQGAYAFVLLKSNYLIAARDPKGIRPLSLGKLGDSYVIASETSAFDIIAAKFVRDIKAGEIIAIDLKTNEITSHMPFKQHTSERMCLFEYVYFAKPSSNILGNCVHTVRYKTGKRLAQEAPANADLVIPIPDSGVPAALGYSDESGIPFTIGLVRSHYIGRTFIEPAQSIRGLGVRLKFAPLEQVIRGKRIVLIDDSIVRGTTCQRIIKMLRSVGVEHIDMRIASPKVKHPCFYGIDFATNKELVANNKTTEDIAKEIGADSLAYISLEGLTNATGRTHETLCHACFSGDYPVFVNMHPTKLAFEE